MTTASIAQSWRRFLIDVTFGRNYPAYFSMTSMTVRGSPRNPILDELLPSLLHIKCVAILDAALIAKLDAVGIKPKQFTKRYDLNGRLETALAAGLLKDITVLHQVRQSRNDVAHEFEGRVDWKSLDGDIITVHGALQDMGFVTTLPRLDIKWERVPKKEFKNPNTVLGFDYRISVVEGKVVWADIQWEEEILPPNF